MNGSESAGSAIWVSSVGLDAEQLRAAVDSAVAQVPHEDVVVVGRHGEAETVGRASGVMVVDDDGASLSALLASSSAKAIIVLRWGTLAPGAVTEIEAFLRNNVGVDVIYGDSVTSNGAPLFRPLFSPIRLRSNDYLGPVVAIRIHVLKAIGGIDRHAARSHVLEVALRAHDAGSVISLLPVVIAREDLAFNDFSDTVEAQRAAVGRYLAAKGVDARIEEVAPFVRRIRYDVVGAPLVSIVIPTRGGSAVIAGGDRVLVVEAVRGIIERSTYRHLQFVIVADLDTPVAVIEELEVMCGDALRLIAWTDEFNFSAKMNRGVLAADGEYVVLLNDDVELVSPDWIETMVGLAQQDGVGIVGAMLYFEDSTLQHAGQVYVGAVAGHAAFGWPGGQNDSIMSLSVDHEVSGVTAACALMRRDLFLELGGFTLALPGNYNDVDLNMKVRTAGYSAVFSPWVRLYHFESKSRDPKILDSDLLTLQARWAGLMQVEMYSRML
ncbi:glycosyltransferase [Glaciibacter flavus]|uniref:Glycosyltransferase n=1 Tax=Orlajensenia flava TaxID=2565934 RepID=A0A4S4G0X7_9MICO|nr:glycosyltransferase [Glaciibacter flavus]